jgi:hypothetical protein
VIATGFDFEKLHNGSVLIRFCDDNDNTITTQLITEEGLRRLPVVIHAFFLAVEKGPEAAQAFLNNLKSLEDQRRVR